jgi:two-component system response regulator HydG
VLQEGEVVRVGGEKTIAVNVRLVAASNKPFEELIPTGKFRLDLYYRLSTVVLRMPALRERREDIPTLVRELTHEFSQKYDLNAPRIADDAMDLLVSYRWPGNIRELRNTIERVFLLLRGQAPSRGWFEAMFASEHTLANSASAPLPSRHAPPSVASLPYSRQAALYETLARHNGNKSAAARALGVTRKTIHQWLKKN